MSREKNGVKSTLLSISQGFRLNWSYGMRLTKTMPAKSTFIPINYRNSETF
jgi:hypothetical protein